MVRGRHRGSWSVFAGVAHCLHSMLERFSLTREAPVGLCAKSEDHVRGVGLGPGYYPLPMMDWSPGGSTGPDC